MWFGKNTTRVTVGFPIERMDTLNYFYRCTFKNTYFLINRYIILKHILKNRDNIFQIMGLKIKEKKITTEDAKAHKRKKQEIVDREGEGEAPVKKFNISLKMQSSLMVDKQTDEAKIKKTGPKIIIAKSTKDQNEEKSQTPPKKLNKVVRVLFLVRW